MQFPKILWLMWLQGIESAPLLVRRCIQSWQRCNPEWDIRILNRENVDQWVSLTIPEEKFTCLTPAHQAAHIRLRLLETYGGVWADATCLCMIPLEQWLPHISHEGFFAFRWQRDDILRGTFGLLYPGRDRIIASWFLAATPGNYTATRLSQEFSAYWTNNTFNNNRRAVRSIAHRILNRSPELAACWINPFVTKVLRVHPYLVVNSVFTKLLASDQKVKAQWQTTSHLFAAPAHLLSELGPSALGTDEALKDLHNESVPIQKLNWKKDVVNISDDSLLNFCLQNI